MKIALAALALALGFAGSVAHADEAVVVSRNARGEKVWRFKKGLELDARTQLPRVVYYLQRSPVDYPPTTLELHLLDKIHLSTTRPPF